MKDKIMVVDDEMDIARLVKINLEKAGFEVSMLNNPKLVLETAKTFKPKMITLDIMMPEMDGFQVLKALKDDPETKDIPVIMVSVVSAMFKEQVFRQGAVDFITKPVDFEKLKEIVAKVFRQEQPQQQKIYKVLVVDDEPDILNLIKNVVSKTAGIKVTVLQDGEAAIETASKEKFNLIILDLYIPGMDGFQVLQALKTGKETADIPVIILTGNDMKGYREKCLFLGASQYITKPFSADILVSEIKKQLQHLSEPI